MTFNSIAFLVFLAITFTVYWSTFIKTYRIQNLILLISSYFFYAYWDYRFLSLILFSTLCDFFIGIQISKKKTIPVKKLLLYCSIILNVGLLFVFKYFNFFLDSLIGIVNVLGFNPNIHLLNIILPVGISFYTFQTLSYTIDVYKNKITPTKDFILFSTYVSFFPQLVAGPIERAQIIFPQLSKKRFFSFNQAELGIRRILVGFFKKVIIADSLAPIVDYTFSNYNELSSFSLILGALYFTIQIYCDFSGYSDIAVGVAKLFGINLMENFQYPYFSKNIGEFWKRWHISLTNWFRDYIFITLGGSRGTLSNSIKNVFIVFIISGLWHGANWTYVMWGLIHSIFYIPHYILNKHKTIKTVKMPPIISGILTFIIVMLSWIFFRSPTIIDAFNYLIKLFSFKGFEIPLNPANNLEVHYYLFFVLGIVSLDLFTSINRTENLIQKRIINVSLLVIILLFLQIDISESFIYFQF